MTTISRLTPHAAAVAVAVALLPMLPHPAPAQTNPTLANVVPESEHVTVQARITAINRTTRAVTLEPLGQPGNPDRRPRGPAGSAEARTDGERGLLPVDRLRRDVAAGRQRHAGLERSGDRDAGAAAAFAGRRCDPGHAGQRHCGRNRPRGAQRRRGQSVRWRRVRAGRDRSGAHRRPATAENRRHLHRRGHQAMAVSIRRRPRVVDPRPRLAWWSPGPGWPGGRQGTSESPKSDRADTVAASERRRRRLPPIWIDPAARGRDRRAGWPGTRCPSRGRPSPSRSRARRGCRPASRSSSSRTWCSAR